MTLAPGTRLGPYEILGRLELAGLGDVYRVRDHDNRRGAAMRVLRAEFAGNPQQLKQFEQEARAAALLSHPNILTVHDVGTDAHAAYVISEPIEGKTLRDVLKDGPLRVRTAIQYGVQIAHALAAAHEKGVVHRDLKPENVLVGADGRVRVVGFGLAAVTQTESALAGLKGVSPGSAIGTPSYMSPEQVRGASPDAKSDMFTFGAILFEMLTGAKAFGGETPLETMTAVGKAEAPKLPPELELPPVLVRIIEMCLRKTPPARPSASDAARALHELWQQASPAPDIAPPARAVAPAAHVVTAPPTSRPVAPPAVVAQTSEPEPAGAVEEPAGLEARPGRRVGIVIAAVVAVVVLVLLIPVARRVLQSAWSGTVPESRSTPLATMTMPDRPLSEFALSPDGQRLAFTAVDSSGQRRLWTRSLTVTDERPLEGTEGAAFPFWSPDSRFVAFFAQGALRKIPAEGGAVAVVTDAAAASPGAWSGGNVIVFARGGEGGPLYRVSASGGTPSPATGLRSGEAAHGWPVFLADGRRFLYTILPSGEGEPAIHAASVDDTGTDQPVLSNASQAAVVEGYVFFIRGHALTVQPFDQATLAMRGDALQVGGGVPSDAGGEGVRAFSLSTAGVLAYQIGPASDPARSRLVWLDRAGGEVGTVGEPADYGDVSLSPNGSRVAVSVRAPGAESADILLVDIDSGMETRVTTDAADDTAPVWSPDGRRILFASTRSGTKDIFQKAATGAGSEVAIVDGQGDQIAYDWSGDGRYLLYQTNEPRAAAGGNFDLWARMLPGGPSFAYFRTIREATLPRLSPDRRWVAFTSFENGRTDVYVAPFPRYTSRTRVSPRGGSWPRWRRDGDELFYVAADGRLMAVPVKGGSSLGAGEPMPLFQLRAKSGRGYAYDVAADGQRILVNVPGEGAIARPVTLVDWRSRLR